MSAPRKQQQEQHKAIDLRKRLSAPHFRKIRAFADGEDMTLRRIARSGAVLGSDITRLRRAIGALSGDTWLARRLAEIECEYVLARAEARKLFLEAKTAATSKKKSSIKPRRYR